MDSWTLRYSRKWPSRQTSETRNLKDTTRRTSLLRTYATYNRSYKRTLGISGMTGGLVATLGGLTTSTNKLQTTHTLSTNYTEHIRLPYFASEHTMHRWTPTYIASRKNNKMMRQLINYYYIAHCTTTSEPDYCQLSQRYTTRFMDPLHNWNEQPPTICQPWTDVAILSEAWGNKQGKG